MTNKKLMIVVKDITAKLHRGESVTAIELALYKMYGGNYGVGAYK